MAMGLISSPNLVADCEINVIQLGNVVRKSEAHIHWRGEDGDFEEVLRAQFVGQSGKNV